MSSSNTTTYADCVSSLRSSLSHLSASVSTLETGISDFPRLINVLKSVRHYELIPQSTLSAAEASLRDEIGPCISLLLSRADAQVERQDRRIETLKARAELQQGRLSNNNKNDFSRHQTPSSTYRQKLRGEDRLRAKAVRQRKEALQYGVERLELEVEQKERELRRRLEA